MEKYDTVARTWTTLPHLWDGATTDLAAFSHGGKIYAVGGYKTPSYETSSRVTIIDPLTGSSTFDAAPHSPRNLKNARGDIMAATTSTYAYVQGGYNSSTNFCETLPSVERYDFARHVWERIESRQSLQSSSADGVLIAMAGMVYSIGGETKSNCDQKTTVAEGQVSVLSELLGVWIDETSLPYETFRFAASAVPDVNSIYIFGGQGYYDSDCNCFPISDQVRYFKDRNWVIDNLDSAAGGLLADKGAAWAGAAAAAAIATAAVLLGAGGF